MVTSDRVELLLSDDERAVLGMLAQGVPLARVAERLGISPRTMRRRVRQVVARFGATKPIEVIVDAVRRGEL